MTMKLRHTDRIQLFLFLIFLFYTQHQHKVHHCSESLRHHRRRNRRPGWTTLPWAGSLPRNRCSGGPSSTWGVLVLWKRSRRVPLTWTEIKEPEQEVPQPSDLTTRPIDLIYWRTCTTDQQVQVTRDVTPQKTLHQETDGEKQREDGGKTHKRKFRPSGLTGNKTVIYLILRELMSLSFTVNYEKHNDWTFSGSDCHCKQYHL